MGTLKTCLAVVNDFTADDFAALEAKAKEYAGDKPLTNSHFIKAAQDAIATIKSDVESIQKGMEPEAAPPKAEEKPAEPPKEEAKAESVADLKKAADDVYNRVKELRAQQQALLSKSGRIPNEGTTKRQQWDSLGEQIGRATDEWAAADTAARKARKTDEDLTKNTPRSNAERMEAAKRAYAKLKDSMGERLDEGDAQAIESALEAGDYETARDLIREVANEARASRAQLIEVAENRLSEAEMRKLESAYGSDRDKSAFWRKLEDDVVRYVNEGAEAVSKAIRSIIKAISEGVLAVALVFNPNISADKFAFDLPTVHATTITKTAVIKDSVPDDAVAKMSPLAQTVYENMAPTAKKSGKGFIIADKPNGMLHLFNADGSLLAQDAALFGKDTGDKLGKSSLLGGPKITPAGPFSLRVGDSEYAGGKSLDLVESYDPTDNSTIAVHAAYLGDPKEDRLGRLKSASAADNKISYGCVNTAHDTFLNTILPNIDNFNGGMMFVLPDAVEQTEAMFPAETETTTETFETKSSNASDGQRPEDLVGDRRKAATEADRVPKAGDTDIRYRSAKAGDPPSAPMPKAELDKIVADVNKALGGDAGVTILDSITDIDPNDTAGSRAGALIDGQVYLFRDGIPDGAQGLKTVFHELFHKGLRNLLNPEQYHRVMNRLYDQSNEVRKLANQYLEDPANKADIAAVGKQYPQNSANQLAALRALAVDEALAKMAEDSTLLNKPGLVRQIGNWFAGVADALGMTKLAQWLRSAGTSPLQQFINDAIKASVHGQSWGNANRFRNATQVQQDYARMAEKLNINALGKARRFVLSSSFLRDLGERFGSKLKGVEQYVKSTFDMSAAAAAIQEKATEVRDAIHALKPKEQEELFGLMADATAKQVVMEPDGDRNNEHHATITKNAAGENVKVMDPIVAELQARFAKLSDKQKTAYRKARDELAANWKKRGELLARAANDIYDPLIKEAERQGDDKKVEQFQRERRAFLADTNARLSQIQGDYFPMMRFGEWVVTKKSPAYEKLAGEVDAAYDALNRLYDKYEKHTPEQRKAIAEVNRKLKAAGEEVIGEFTEEEAAEIKKARDAYNLLATKLESMKSSEADYYMEQFESEGEAQLHAREIGGEFALKRENLRELNPISRTMLSRLEESMAASMRARGNVTALRDAKKAMYEVFLQSLPERSALMRQAKRKNVAGFSKDMERAVISSMLKDSFYLSRMEFSDKITDALNVAYNDAQEQKAVDLQEVHNELARRYAASVKYVETPVQDAMAGAAYVYRLGVSPGYLLANMLQPTTVSIPMLFSRHGAKSVTEFGKALGQTWKIVGKSLKAAYNGEIDYKNAGLSSDEVAMLDEMLKQRLLNVTLVADLARTADGQPTSKFASMMAKPSHFVEVINRMSTALAAYRMEKAKSGNDLAVKYAQRVLVDTHFDYSTENAPYWMKPGTVPFNKVAFQFKKYQLGMISMFVKVAAAMAKGDKVAKAEARKQLMGVLVSHFAIGGVLGLPAAGTLASLATLIGQAFGDDDEPWDARIALRNWAYDNFGKETGDVLAKGLPTLLGADLSQKAGLGDLLNPTPTLRSDKDGRELGMEILATAMGPAVGLGLDMFEGMSYFAKGDFLKGTEKMIPKWVADPVKAYRFNEEGITTRKGVVAVRPDEISAWDAALQAAGVPSNRITDSYEARAAQQNAMSAIKDTAGEIKKDWLEAKMQGDDAEAQAIWQRIQTEVNPVRKRNGLEPITLSALYQFRANRAKEETKYQKYGAPTNAKLAEMGRFARP